ncbi:uncharacterized protein C11orf97 homolog [Nannospalax galili]|uniref:uncharacterized protein C11orf97 homolog n=1 Tax=Nannospalax galili TaxID=1026970 RepID=UPI0004ED070A|nr:uncharacterized protein C11orf97 homolog [Nannospalax galili]
MRRQEALGTPAGTAEATDREQPRPAGLGSRVCAEPGGPEPRQPREQWKTFLYCEPHRRIREVLEEELYIRRDECHVKSPPAVALDGVWSIQRNLPVGSAKPGQPSRNSLLPQAKYYSRHGGPRR